MASENLQIVASQTSRGQKIFSLKGPLSIHTLFKFQEAVRSESSSVLILDFTEVPFIDSAGLGAVVSAHVNARKSDRRILFAAFNGQARTLIEMTHVNDLLETYDTIDSRTMWQQSPSIAFDELDVEALRVRLQQMLRSSIQLHDGGSLLVDAAMVRWAR